MKELDKLLDDFERAVSWSDACFDDNYGTDEDEERSNDANKKLDEIRSELIAKFKEIENKYTRIKNFAPGENESFFGKNLTNE